MDSFSAKELSSWYKYPEYLQYDIFGQDKHRRTRIVKQIKQFRPEAKTILLHGAGATRAEILPFLAEREVWSTFSIIKGPRCSVSTEELPKDYFDIIIANEVVEHWTDPNKELSLISSLLKPTGIFTGSTGIVDEQHQYGEIEDWDYIDERCVNVGHVLLWSWKAIEIISTKYNLKNKSSMMDKNFRKTLRLPKTSGFFILEKP